MINVENKCKNCGHFLIKKRIKGKLYYKHYRQYERFETTNVQCRCGCKNPEPKGDLDGE